MKNRLFTLIISALLVMGIMPTIAMPVQAAASNGDTILAFSSDIHNEPTTSAYAADLSAYRTVSWINTVNNTDGQIDYLTVCGDIGRSKGQTQADQQQFSSDGYWNWTKAAIDIIDNGFDSNKTTYTTGNHEIEDGGYPQGPTELTGRFHVDQLMKSGSSFEVYCMGSASGSYGSAPQEYTQEQINKLVSYLNGVSDSSSKIIYIASHYPLHSWAVSWEMRTTGKAEAVITAINNAAKSKNLKIVFIWGHNHSRNDDNYKKVYKPGETIRYGSSDSASSKINFWYAPAGCMSDYENSHSGLVVPKGLVCRIPTNGVPELKYYKLKKGSDNKVIKDAQGNEQFEVYQTIPMEVPELTYSVTYRANGGSGNPPTDSTKYRSGEKATIKSASGLYRTGYSLSGWTSDAFTGTKTEGETFDVTDDSALDASWSANSYKIAYAGIDGATISTKPVTATWDSAFTISNPTKTGYDFAGWDISGMDSNTHYWDSGSATTRRTGTTATRVKDTRFKNLNATKDATVTFTAQWQEHIATLTYNANGHGVAPASATMRYSESANAAGAMTATGYTFGGWKRSDNNVVINAGAQVKTANAEPKALTLTGQWTANTYRISYNLGGGTYGTDHPNSASWDSVFTLDNPTRQNYYFAGWDISGMDSNTHYWDSVNATTSRSGTSATGVTDTKYKNLNASNNAQVTFTAKWSRMPVYVNSIVLDKETMDLDVGESVKLTVTVLPTNATNKDVTWRSADSSIARVDNNGNVTAVGAGSVDITVESKDGTKIKAVCKVNVTDSQAETELNNAKTNAKAALDGYRNPVDYRDAQKGELAASIAKWKNSIDAASTIEDVDRLLANAKSEIDRIKTNAQLTSEEEAAVNGVYDPSLPKASIKKPSAGKKSFTAKWKKFSKKNAGKVNGIEIWAAPDTNFTTGRVIRTAGKSKSSKKISGLSKKATYYVKVRTYKYVNGVKYAGAWSKTKKVKTK